MVIAALFSLFPQRGNSQRRRVVSLLPDTAWRPSGEKATVPTSASWPRKRRSSLPVCTSQSRTMLSTGTMVLPSGPKVLFPLAERARRPSGATATHCTKLSCPTKRHSPLPLPTSHSLTERSHPPPDRARRPSGLKVTLLTVLPWPSKRRSSLPVCMSQSEMVVFSLPDSARRPSREMATLAAGFSRVPRRHSSLPVPTSHSRRVLSHVLPESARRPSGVNATHCTASVCPLNLRTSFPVSTCHRRTVSSAPVERQKLPSGETATLLTEEVC